MKQTVEYYLNLPYTYVVIPDDDCFFIKVKELEGCMSQGNTIEEAYNMIKDAMNAWLEVAIEEDDKIPLPDSIQESNYSGKLSLRMPKSLHKKVSKEAKKEGVSINSYIISCLAENNTFNRIKRILDLGLNSSIDLQKSGNLTDGTQKWFSEISDDNLIRMKDYAPVVVRTNTNIHRGIN